jgi:multisubunit Na+/H+ antiporter MnhB subunit
MKIKSVLQTSIASLILMGYGWYLGQLHQSGPDIAGILLFITGAVGLALAFILRSFTNKYAWHNSWFANIMTGIVGCGIAFALIALYARLHG